MKNFWDQVKIIEGIAIVFVRPFICIISLVLTQGFHSGSMVKNLPAMQDMQVWSLGQEDPLENGIATHSSILAWRTPRTQEPGGLQFMDRMELDTTDATQHACKHASPYTVMHTVWLLLFHSWHPELFDYFPWFTDILRGVVGPSEKAMNHTPVLLPGKSHGRRHLVGCSPWGRWVGRTRLRDFTFTFRFHALGKEMATHSSVLAWRIPGTGKPGGLPSMGSHRVGHDWSDLAAASYIQTWPPKRGES